MGSLYLTGEGVRNGSASSLSPYRVGASSFSLLLPFFFPFGGQLQVFFLFHGSRDALWVFGRFLGAGERGRRGILLLVLRGCSSWLPLPSFSPGGRGLYRLSEAENLGMSDRFLGIPHLRVGKGVFGMLGKGSLGSARAALSPLPCASALSPSPSLSLSLPLPSGESASLFPSLRGAVFMASLLRVEFGWPPALLSMPLASPRFLRGTSVAPWYALGRGEKESAPPASPSGSDRVKMGALRRLVLPRWP